MISEKAIQEAVRRIVEATHPTKVILFGSYARDEADEGSDLDFMVIVRRFDEKTTVTLLRKRANLLTRVLPGSNLLLHSRPKDFPGDPALP
jgi:predicted nucleotidyltransferase